MRFLAIVLVMLVLPAAGCATGRPLGWIYKPDNGVGIADGPLALWGEDGTLAFSIIRCNAADRVLEIEELEVEPFDGARPVRIAAANFEWSGTEQMDPPDGVAVSRIRVPLDVSLWTAVEAGHRLTINRASDQQSLPSGPEVGRVIAECRTAAATHDKRA